MTACGVLVSQPGMEPEHPVLEAWRLNMEVPVSAALAMSKCSHLRLLHKKQFTEVELQYAKRVDFFWTLTDWISGFNIC